MSAFLSDPPLDSRTPLASWAPHLSRYQVGDQSPENSYQTFPIKKPMQTANKSGVFFNLSSSMDPFDFGLLAPPARSLKFEPEAYFQTDNLGPQDLDHLEKELEQAKQKLFFLRAQEQQRATASPRETKQIMSESRYWTNEERQRFKKALKTFGTDFTAIAKFVGTRSSTQVRTHAQKYYAKLIRDYKRSGKAQAAVKDQKAVANRPSIGQHPETTLF